MISCRKSGELEHLGKYLYARKCKRESQEYQTNLWRTEGRVAVLIGDDKNVYPAYV
jgi:hypothetical protein